MTRASYNPLVAPKPEDWLALNGQQHLDLVQDYHRDAGIAPPDMKAHASLHVMAEFQIALADGMLVRRTMHRLMDEGLDRHEAIHAVGQALAEFYDLLTADANPILAYVAALERLTADHWRQSGYTP